MEGQKKNSFALIGAVVLLVLALIYGVFRYIKRDAAVNSQGDVVQVPKGLVYKDGAYSAIGSYFSPGGEEQIEVSLTLKDDVIVDTTVKQLATRPISIKLQQVFTDNYKTLVVGRKINDVVLDKVSGSSLTPIGFNNALESIKNTAQI